MRIGIINIEPKINNTAYMQIAAHHRARGDEVEWWSPLTDRRFDHVYCSSLFDFTDKSEVPERAICGGTGFDIHSRLSVIIENSKLDYGIYPKCKTSYLWFSRGCVRNCPWCVVPQKEGKIHAVVPKNLNPNGKYVTVCDNNFFASPFWRKAIAWLVRCEQPVDMQGIDIRLITDEQCRALTKLHHEKQIKFAWDNASGCGHEVSIDKTEQPLIDEQQILAGIKRLTKYIKPWRLMCYVLVGFNSTEKEDLYRIETLRTLKIDPFVMPFDKTDLYQRALTRWVNDKAIFNKNNPRIMWEDYWYRVEKQEAAGTGWAT